MGKFNEGIEQLLEIFEQHQEELFDEEGKVRPPAHPIWNTIAKKSAYTFSKKYLYTILSCNRHGVKEKLRPSTCPETFNTQSDDMLLSSSTDSEESLDETSKKKFNITLSPQEWLDIFPEGRKYKDGRMYSILKPGKWTTLVASHFWDLTKLPCALSFKRAKVHEEGVFLQIRGICKHCQSRLMGKVLHKPRENRRVIIDCVYQGGFDMCKCTVKRQLRGEARKKTSELLISNRLAPNAHRKELANALMEHGDVEPSILPNRHVLKTAKHERRKENLLCKDPLSSVYNLKYLSPFDNYIKDIGMDRFFVHYWATPQIHVYNNYCRKALYSTISIDATGRVVRKLERPNGEKSRVIFLYDITVKDPFSKMQYSVCDMLSERHDSDSITHWLKFWQRDGALIPNEVVCDMSIALISAVVRSFTNFPSLEAYLQYSYDYAILKNADNSHSPKCYVRCDVAHVVKIFCGWPCLKAALPRSRQFYKRCLGQLVQASSVERAKNILELVFVVALSETSGTSSEGEETPCEISKRSLRRLIGDELNDDFVDQEATVDDILLDDNNFVHWGRNIESIARNKLLEGNEDNCQYLPAIVPQIISFLKLLPLWSHIMSSSFPGSSRTASSSSVELNFNDIKNRIFANYSLPIRVDEFLTVHIRSLEGTMKLAASACHNRTEGGLDENEDVATSENETSGATRQFTTHRSVEATSPLAGAAASDSDAENGGGLNCLDEDEDMNVETSRDGGDDYPETALRSIEPAIPQDDLNEFQQEENWGGEVVTTRKRSSYLQKNSEWLHIDLNQKVNVIPIGILRNGNLSNLKPVKINEHKYVLRNTCGFDALVSLLCTNFCDSSAFSQEINGQNNAITEIIKQIIKQVSTKAYSLRGSLLLRIFDRIGDVIKLPNDTYEIATQCTVESLVRKLCILGELRYSSIETIRCHECGHLRIIPTAVVSFTCSTYGRFQEELQRYFSSCLVAKTCVAANCTSKATSKLDINESYVFLESTDVSGHIIPVTLRNIPREISFHGRKYQLGGLISYSGSLSYNPNVVGHFRSYCRRLNGKWEMYDDLLNKKTDCSIVEEVVPHLFFYRIVSSI